jgi:hypothetical protein
MRTLPNNKFCQLSGNKYLAPLSTNQTAAISRPLTAELSLGESQRAFGFVHAGDRQAL